MRFFKLVMIVLLKIWATDKIFGKTCLKIIRDAFFFKYVVCNRWRERGTQSFGEGWYPTEGDASNLWTCRESVPPPLPIRSISGTSWSAHRKTLRRVLGLFTATILKRVNESIYFQSNKFTTCKVKAEKEAANSLMAFNLPKIIRPFQDKKHLRT